MWTEQEIEEGEKRVEALRSENVKTNGRKWLLPAVFLASLPQNTNHLLRSRSRCEVNIMRSDSSQKVSNCSSRDSQLVAWRREDLCQDFHFRTVPDSGKSLSSDGSFDQRLHYKVCSHCSIQLSFVGWDWVTERSSNQESKQMHGRKNQSIKGRFLRYFSFSLLLWRQN